ncbi:MAG: hypothetical protein OXR67_17025 [Chloroflexota bacterium]|nr:hypothetical protein [Chloroflexota bacterium]
MPDLTDEDIQTLARAAGVTIPQDLVAEVGYSLNGVLEALDNIDIPGLDEIEPLPIIRPAPSTGEA